MKKFILVCMLMAQVAITKVNDLAASNLVDNKIQKTTSEDKASVVEHKKAAMTEFNEDYLFAFAEVQGFGYKTANLTVLDTFCDRFNQTTQFLSVKVPRFVGIPSSVIIELLKRVDCDVQAQWSRVVATMADQKTDAQTFTQDFLCARDDFEQVLAAAFDRLVAQLSNDTSVPLLNLFPPVLIAKMLSPKKSTTLVDELDELLVEAKKNKSRLMVRSTGREDTNKLANAGGNETIANVFPHEREVLKAIKKVVISYFGMRSLKQRLALGDRTVFEPDVFVPVLVQVMVGETDANKTPRCGVLFTQDPESKADGITVIQATYGHNEAVVNSLVPVDTYHVVRSTGGTRSIYPVIRRKTMRLVPDADTADFLYVNNSERLALGCALNKPMLETLGNLAQQLESYYNYPLDIEFVIKEGVVYLVQARPIKDDPKKIQPSYLAAPATTGVLQSTTIGAAGGAVRVVTKPSECIIARTIAEALDSYQLPTTEASAIQVILIGTMAASTSHAATTFRGEGKAVVAVHDLQVVREALRNNKKLLIDTQQECVKVMDAEQDHTVLLDQGWRSYPASRHYSVIPAFVDIKPAAKLLAQTYQPLQQKSHTLAVVTKTEQKLKELITTLQTSHDQAQIQDAAAVCIAQTVGLIRFYRTAMSLPESISHDCDLLLASIVNVCEQIISCTAQGAKIMQRLFFVRMLEALLYQQPSADDSAQPLSLAGLGKLLKQELAAIKSCKGHQPHDQQAVALLVQLKKLTQHIMVPTVQKQFNDLLNAFVKEENWSALKRLATLIGVLNAHDILPTWLYTCFTNDMKKTGNRIFTSPCHEALLTTWESLVNDSKLFAELQEKQITLKNFDLAACADPVKATAAWDRFDAILINYFIDPVFISKFNGANTLEQAAVCVLLGKTIDCFDLAIKEMKGSQLWPLDKKLVMFQTMLKRYRDLFVAIIKIVPQGAINYGASNLDYHINFINNIVDRATGFTEQDLQATSNFNVPSFTIGSGMNLSSGVINPSRGEDAFSLIHQCLLVAVSALAKKDCLPEQPKLLQQVIDTIITKNFSKSLFNLDSKYKASLIGQKITPHTVTLHYNLPLRNHSCQFFATYKAKKNKVNFTVQFYGHRPERWYTIGSMAALLDIAGVCSIKNILVDGGISFTCNITTHTDVQLLSRVISKMVDHANSEYRYPDLKEVVSRINKISTLQDIQAINKKGQALLGNIFRGFWLNDVIFTLLKNSKKNDLSVAEQILLLEHLKYSSRNIHKQFIREKVMNFMEQKLSHEEIISCVRILIDCYPRYQSWEKERKVVEKYLTDATLPVIERINLFKESHLRGLFDDALDTIREIALLLLQEAHGTPQYPIILNDVINARLGLPDDHTIMYKVNEYITDKLVRCEDRMQLFQKSLENRFFATALGSVGDVALCLLKELQGTAQYPIILNDLINAQLGLPDDHTTMHMVKEYITDKHVPCEDRVQLFQKSLEKKFFVKALDAAGGVALWLLQEAHGTAQYFIILNSLANSFTNLSEDCTIAQIIKNYLNDSLVNINERVHLFQECLIKEFFDRDTGVKIAKFFWQELDDRSQAMVLGWFSQQCYLHDSHAIMLIMRDKITDKLVPLKDRVALFKELHTYFFYNPDTYLKVVECLLQEAQGLPEFSMIVTIFARKTRGYLNDSSNIILMLKEHLTDKRLPRAERLELLRACKQEAVFWNTPIADRVIADSLYQEQQWDEFMRALDNNAL